MDKQGKSVVCPPAPPWGPAEELACQRLVELALAEDLGPVGDITSEALIDAKELGRARFITRAAGVLAGSQSVILVFRKLDPRVEVQFTTQEGESVPAGVQLGTVYGRMRSILIGERSALNFLQRLSGVATLTRRFVEAVADLPCRILDTRKTLPGWRRLEKYAVRCGGGANHRLGLFDGVLIKDNHLAALEDRPEPIREAVARARKSIGVRVPLEVEVETLQQLEQALAVGPNRILLDNMDVPRLVAAVRRRNQVAREIPLEASGGVTLANVRQIAETGVDFISIGALTHSAPALDIALDYA